MRIRNSIFQNIDWWVIMIYYLLILMGWINIYAAVYDDAHQSIFDMTQRYGKQIVWIGFASIVAFLIILLDAKFYEGFSFVIYVLTITLLLSVLVGGKEIAGSKSWFQIGSFAIQPAEFAKFATALALAKYLSMPNINLKNIADLIKAGIIIFTPAILVILQNDTGSALVYTVLIFVLYREGMSGTLLLIPLSIALIFIFTILFGSWMIISVLAAVTLFLVFLFRKQKRAIFSLLAIFVISVGVSYSVNYTFQNILGAHQRTRINVLFGKEIDLHGAGYNVHQSKIAIGSGRVYGKGFLKGTQTKFNFVPEQSTDFIFCTVGEEWGFLGSSMVVILFLVLFTRLIYLAERQRDKFSRVYGYGVVGILFFHFAINIAMTIGLAPVIGIPLPFFSYGGSSLWGFTILLFIFLKLDANRKSIY